MYNITREQAATMLNISTRSIDRYIKNGKLRSKKEGKIVYINENDIDNFLNPISSKQEIIINSTDLDVAKEEVSVDENIFKIYEDLKNEIVKKDEEIKDLTLQIGKMQEIVKNSISMVEFKKSQFLLEESKNSISVDLENTKKELETKNIEFKKERNLNYILLSALIVLIIITLVIWFMKI